MLYLSENHSHVYSEISANILLLLLYCLSNVFEKRVSSYETKAVGKML